MADATTIPKGTNVKVRGIGPLYERMNGKKGTIREGGAGRYRVKIWGGPVLWLPEWALEVVP